MTTTAKNILLLFIFLFHFGVKAQVAITGELKKWHRVTLTFDGVNTSERDSINPFTSYRLNVTFSNGLQTFLVPGYYAADGNAAETSDSTGNKWRVNFCPSDTGTWIYSVSYRTGPYIAVNDTPNAGVAVPPLDGMTGSFSIGPTDKTGRDNRAKGKLQYVGEHFLRFAETGEYFLKTGTNSPENLLAYYDFDGTYDADSGTEIVSSAPLVNGIHQYGPHVADWNTGDPTWQNGKGKGLIGAVNYLATEEVNSFYFMPFTVDGDGDDVWPFLSHHSQDWERYDISKLDQWEIVFSHMDSLGFNLHFVLSERENQTRLDDDGSLGPQRKLFIRELVARFGHHLAINWNIGEENGHDYLGRGVQTTQDRKDMASYIKKTDPYKSYVNVHTWVGEQSAVYTPLLNYPDFDGASIQMDKNNVHNEVLTWVSRSDTSSHKWVVTHDETVGGVDPDNPPPPNHDVIRVKALWGSLMAGAAGFEVYLGENDLNEEDFRSRDRMWDYLRYASHFFHSYLPYWKMKNYDNVTTSNADYVLALPGKVYASYREFNNPNSINLPCGNYTVKWFDPRNGGALVDGTVTYITGGSNADIGSPPNNQNSDWVALIRNDFDIGFNLTHVSCGVGNDGAIDITPTGGTSPYNFNWSNGSTAEDVSQLTAGQYTVTVTDGAGCVNVDSAVILPDPRVFTHIQATICNNETYFAGGSPQNISGTYFDTIIALSGCDSIIITDLTVFQSYRDTLTVQICDNETYLAGGALQNLPGTYVDTFSTVKGCDSVVVTNLSVLPSASKTVSVSICQGQSYYAGGANRTSSGVYRDTFVAANSCDSVVTTILTVLLNQKTTVNVSICQGDSYYAGGAFQTVAGSYYDTLTAVNGCDSIITTNLTVKPNAAHTVNVNICNGESYFAGGANRTTSGIYQDILVAANGCDSILTTILTVKPNSAHTVNVSICNGASYFAGGANRTTPGIYRDTLVAANGCDSVLTTILTVKPNSAHTVNVSICNGQSYFAGGANQTASGTYQDILVAANGCDSILTTNLTVKPNSFKTLNVSICPGESYFAGGANQTTSGTYQDILVAANGCDSILTTNLTVKPNAFKTLNVGICQGESYFAGGANRITSGTYYDTLVAANSCDSIVTTNLTVKPNATHTINVSICNGESYFAGGANRTISGIYQDILVAANGCDSILTTILMVKPNSAHTVNVSICNGESYFAGGANRTVSGTYRDTLMATNGCDSILTTILTVKSNSFKTINVSICSGESYFAGGANRTISGTYRDTLVAANGCDSVLTTNLAVKPNSFKTVGVSICSGQSYFAGGANRTTSGIYRDTLTAANGCDSVLTTVLVVKPNSFKTTNVAICPGESYFAGGANRTAPGTYKDTLVAFNGCDSILTTNLTVKSNSFNTISVGICNGESYYAGGASQTTSGTYVDTFQAANGCDSVLTTVLSVEANIIQNRTLSACSGESVFAGGELQTVAGIYYDTLTAFAGCDSIVITTLNFFDRVTTTQDVLIYAGNSYFAGGAFQTESGTYYDTLVSQYLCDSIVVTVLSVEDITSDLTINVIENKLIIRTTLEKTYVDNTYGTNAVGWGITRTLDSITSSDHLQWAFFDANSVKKLDFSVDYFSQSAASPSGYKSLGISGGEGHLIAGSDSNILNTTTSIDENFNKLGYVLTANSPATDTNYTPNPAYPNWIYDVWYEATVDLKAFGSAGFGYFDIVNVHASPDKDDEPESAPDTLIPPKCPRRITANIIICQGESYFVGGAYQTIPGTYYDTLLGADSCEVTVISNLSVQPAPVTNLSVSICEGESYFTGGAYQSVSGLYYDTLNSYNGCDSIVATQLNLKPSPVSTIPVTICTNETYFAGGGVRNTSGLYYDTLSANNGCDSIVVTDLTVLPTVTSNIQVSICQGDSVLIHGSYHKASGIFYDTLTASNGCDSLLTLVLSVSPAITHVVAVSICEGDSYFAGGANQTLPGLYRDTFSAMGTCDSIVITALSIIPPVARLIPVTICSNESYFAGGAWQNTSGFYYDTLTRFNGCDSVLITSLTVLSSYNQNLPVSICQGDSLFAEGAYRSTPGVYHDTLTSWKGCDSIVTIQLSIVSQTTATRTLTICANETVFAGGAYQNTSGIYYDTLVSAGGCDSILTTNLTVLSYSVATVPAVICSGDSLFAGGKCRKTTGLYRDTLLAYDGCDSIIVTDLNVIPQTVSVISRSICQGDSLFAGGTYRIQTGVYKDTLTGAMGCDSILITDLFVESTIHINRSITLCSEDSIFAGGAYQNTSGTYYDTLTAAGGCDSVIITAIDVIEGNGIVINENICSGDSIFLGGAYRKAPGIFFDTIQSSFGCDSFIVTFLSVKPKYFTLNPVSICSGEKYWAGGGFQSTVGFYYDTLSSVFGCDSVIETELTILPVPVTHYPVSICQGESYFVQGTLRTIAGTYYDTLTASNGCDSVLITHLSVLPVYSELLPVSICLGDSYFAGGSLRTNSGIYRDTFFSMGGCDSIVTTVLSVLPPITKVVPVAICANDSYYAGGGWTNIPGIYYDTLTAFNTCDSVVITSLTILPTFTTHIQTAICDGDSVLAGGKYQDASGIYYDTLTARNGCDSVVATHLTVWENYVTNRQVTICDNKSFVAGGSPQTASGIYYDTLSTAHGCDSVIITELEVLSTTSTVVPVLICSGETYYAQGAPQTAPGFYYDTLIAANGCDSVVITDLQVLPTFTTVVPVTICNNGSYYAGGAFQSLAGSYSDTLTAFNGCDSVIITDLTVLPTFTSTVQVTICDNDSYFAQGNFQTIAGTYYDTLTASNGCDSVIITELTVKPTYLRFFPVNICANESYYTQGANQTTSGIYIDSLVSEKGCDSVVVIILTVNPTFSTSRTVTICSNESYFVGGANQSVSGIYYDTLSAANGCDSVVITHLTVEPSYITNNPVTICDNENYFAGGAAQNSSGIYYDTLTALNGCDSIVVTDLTVLPTSATSVSVNICGNESYFVEGAFQTISGTYRDTFFAFNGCDSIVTVDLIVNPVSSHSVFDTVCSNENYFVGGALQNSPGIYYDTFSAANGCDSIIITNLTVLPATVTTVPVTICDNETYLAQGAFQNISGTYYDTLLGANGCDSIVVTELVVLPSFINNVAITICDNQAYYAGGAPQNTSGIYHDTLTAANGCDSVVITALAVLSTLTETQSVSVCDNETYFAGGTLQNTSGVYYDTLAAVNGCDSILITQLTVFPTFVNSVSVDICAGETYFAGGALQNTSGVYYDTLASSNGCDSVIVTNLNALPANITHLAITICGNETYVVGGATQNISGTYYDTLTAANGCDSVVITELDLLPAYSNVVPVTICANENYFAEGAYQNSSGFYYDTLNAINGCDSVVITELNVLPVFNTILPVTICANETYFAQDAVQTTSGSYFDTLTAANGCDSIVRTDLTVLPTYTFSHSVTICDNETWFAQGALQNSSGTYYDTLTAANGCDSMVITDLTVLPTVTSNIIVTICANETYFAQGALQDSSGIYYDTLTAFNGCDSLLATNLVVNPTYRDTVVMIICDHDSIFLGGAYRHVSGIYRDDWIASNGCDSTVLTDLTVTPVFDTLIQRTICQGEVYYAQGAPRSLSGLYYDTLTTQDGFCDSVIITALSVIPISSAFYSVEICPGETYYAGGAIQNSTGIYFDTLVGYLGCDSVVITDLIVKPQFLSNVAASICDNESYFAQGAFQNVSGTYYDTFPASNGCDSIIITELTVFPSKSRSVSVSVCPGEGYFAQGAWQYSSGTYFDIFQTSAGCDSSVTTYLTVLPVSVSPVSVSICAGESYFVQGAFRNSAGTYYDTLTASNGCDSIIITSLIVNRTYVKNVGLSICQGESYFAQGAPQTDPGIYYDTLNSVFGCDSVIVTDLNVLPVFTKQIDVSICNGERYFAGGRNQSAAGTYVDSLNTVLGCDSIIVTNLTVLPNPVYNLFQSVCFGDSIYAGGKYRYTSGTYYDTLAAANGCDSVLVSTVTFNSAGMTTIAQSICSGDSIFFSGQYHKTGGTYFDTVSSVNGCDSVVSMQLALLQSPHANAGSDATICSGQFAQLQASGGISYKWSNGSTTNFISVSPANATQYNVTVTNTLGCTAVDTVEVFVNQSPSVNFVGLNNSYCSNGNMVALSGSPAGGIFSGPGIFGNNFDPSRVSAGSQTLTYRYTDSIGCTGSVNKQVTILPPPLVSFSGLNPYYCLETAAYQLVGSPPNGVFQGGGINSGIFNPISAGSGNHQITYLYTDTNSCTGSSSKSVQVLSPPSVNFSILTNKACINDSPIPLSGSPVGGLFSGNGVSGASFNPSHAGVGGPYMISYLYVDSMGCSNTKSQSISVAQLPSISISGIANYYCVNEDSINLTGHPAGGFFSGTGVRNNYFFPDSTGIGTYPVTYSYTDTTGCTNTTTANIQIRSVPFVALGGLDSVYCLYDPVDFMNGSPPGGTFSGPGVLLNTFNPVEAGPGKYHVVKYNYTGSNGCANSDSVVLTVNQNPVVRVDNIDSFYCTSHPDVTLLGVPSGGVFTGAGVSDGKFRPAIAGAGTHTIFYTYADANSCESIAKVTIKVSQCTGISGINLVQKVEVYPNPFEDYLMIEMSMVKAAQFDFILSDVLGRTVHSENNKVLKGKNTFRIDPDQHLSKGIYFLEIRNKEERYLIKLSRL